MMKNTISMNVSAIGTDDGKSTFEVQRTWNEKGKKAIAIGMYPTISVENCGIDKVLERIENPLAAVTEERAAYLQQEKEFYTVLASKIRE